MPYTDAHLKKYRHLVTWSPTDITQDELEELLQISKLGDIYTVLNKNGDTVALCRSKRTADELNRLADLWLHMKARCPAVF